MHYSVGFIAGDLRSTRQALQQDGMKVLEHRNDVMSTGTLAKQWGLLNEKSD